MKKIKVALLGCGHRGNTYVSYGKKYPEELEVVAVIDISPVALKTTGDEYGIPENRRFSSLDEFINAKIECDSVINATVDAVHYETAKKIIEAGYNQLLEKPIVNNMEQLLELRALANEKGVSILVCHVLRYTPFYSELKKVINDGRIGKILTINMTEHIGTVHFASSFIRGKNADERISGSGLLLQKSCHDTDLMCWLNNFTVPKEVHSFGQRALFTEENAPEGATEFCYQCPQRNTCLYDAIKLQLEEDWFGYQTWLGLKKPLSEITKAEKEEYLQTSEWGQCVYKLKRDLVDRQMVTVLFEDGSMGNLCIAAGSSMPGRDIHIVGSKGVIKGRFEDNKFVVSQCIHDQEKYDTESVVIDVSGKLGGAGHGDGDTCIMRDYVRFLNGDNTSISLTSINDSVNGHACVYAAEKSRRQGTVESINL